MKQRFSRHAFLTVWLVGMFLLCFSTSSALAEDTDKAANQAPEQAEETPQKPEEARPAVQPQLQTGSDATTEIELPDAVNADIQQQVRALGLSLEQRRIAVASSRQRLVYAESLLSRLKDEYESFELRLETAGLNLTSNYASLLKQRLERLQRQSIASDLIEGIQDKLSAAREEQLKLEEFEAITGPGDDVRGQLRSRRSDLLRALHKSVTEHIDVLNDYYGTATALQDQVLDYQTLLQQRLFWLPSASRVGTETFGELYQAIQWLHSELKYAPLKEAISASLAERAGRIGLIAMLLIVLLFKRQAIKENLAANGQFIGNVGRDLTGSTLLALMNSILLALPGVLVFSLAALVLMEGAAFFSALSKGFTAAAFIMFLLALIRNVARKHGLGESHFHWNAGSLKVIRRSLPILMAFVIPVAILTITYGSTQEGAQFDDSLGRLLFMVVSVVLAVFAQRIMTAVRAHRPHSRLLRFLHIISVATPLALAMASLMGYHYTALQLERSLFISICWLAFNAVLYYLGLRALSVRERRITLERLVEQRAAEQKIAEAKEAADAPGDALPLTPDMPEMDLADISQQSSSLLRVMVFVLALTGLLFLWADVIPALQLFNDITLWTIATDLDGGDPLPITLADALLAVLIAAGTVIAAKNLPGTLEVTLLSRMHLQPGSGYAITTITTYVVVLMGVVFCLAVIGVQWSKLQWLIAALGVGLGFGLQEIVANFVSGIILLFERPIRVGDTVTIGGVTGTVSRIRIRATTLLDWDRKEQIIPNKTFVTQELTNWTLSDPITRIVVKVGVAYGSDVDEVQAILTDVAQTNERVVDDPAPSVFCVGFGDSCINFEVWVFVRDLLVDMMPLSHELHASITKALTKANIDIPFPRRDIHLHTQPEPS
ncbi:mechanosensitive ion channel domain-containing protein [Marinobacter sp. LV10MA510-1]|uniref:mechanosensitive ion channel domain-containing protein n=1 Tax=Marinobacter sp. LV10MA510-1 TaxID=1415567 RepID=UPI000BF4591A|nr:mechanosensitive ion channel domain-containing protein [Marinobacter sp. LV10MA510-1]PFG11661.1 potassium efflux system protein [Marinobacter sp. LV10MA510-1]